MVGRWGVNCWATEEHHIPSKRTRVGLPSGNRSLPNMIILGGSLRLLPESQHTVSFFLSNVIYTFLRWQDSRFCWIYSHSCWSNPDLFVAFSRVYRLDLSKNGVYPTASTWMEGDHNRGELWYPIFRQIHFLLLFVHIFIASASIFSRTNNTLGCEIVRYHFKINLSLFRAGLPDYAMNWGSWIHAWLCSLFHFQSFWQNLQIPPIVGGKSW